MPINNRYQSTFLVLLNNETLNDILSYFSSNKKFLGQFIVAYQ